MELGKANQILLTDLGRNDDMDDGDEYVIVESLTVEKPYGWILSFESRKFLETRDIQYKLFGGGMAIVNKMDGSIYYLGSHLPPEEQIEEYERKLKL